MEIKTIDGIEFFCLPDGAKCKIAWVSPMELPFCPKGIWERCPESCEYYEKELGQHAKED